MTTSPSPHPKSPTLLITTLAMYQTRFWAAVGHALQAQGRSIAFISFDDRSTELLKRQGFETFSVHAEELKADTSDSAYAAALQRYGIEHPNFWLSHERITFNITDEIELRRKLLAYLALGTRACTTLQQAGHTVVMVQELGGFVSVVASYFAARTCGIDNWFLEPSFFRGRLFFLKNQFAAQSIPLVLTGEAIPEVRAYLQDTLHTQAIVVPKKDSHQYTTAFKKIVNLRNLKRLMEKAFDKYVLGKHQEFGHIGRHVSVHARMLRNSMALRAHYTPLDTLKPFVYYPLHVPGDMALTLRSPQYLDQIALIDWIARSAPAGHQVAIKEHPAMIGAIDAQRIIALLRRYDNVALLPPSTNNYTVLRACRAVVSVNSKSGAEAALLGKPVLVLGDAFYRDSPLVEKLDHIQQLPSRLSNLLIRPAPDAESVSRYFDAVWRLTEPGELYVDEASNVRTFAGSLLQALGQSGA